ncbi:LPXTG cell wall anchor domain-containing protein [Paenibacillus woosongensis]|uniref:LPXTG cell wall anchor domain-containing protein n=1 Tax=Paenibacillus woosongensis TaxID=307580 RepID=A0AA95I6E6_9BACL|nr:LPXTG cell wall anchor domain-containing protein [Paenibacillus woosongensis]WHX49891.1 LPXTG cell wall anchor domain-containing protein [Paenibacillus woosongensis]
MLPEAEPEDQPPSSKPEKTEKIDDVSVSTLPKTGEASSLPYYIAGLGSVIVGFFLRRKSKKSS